MHHLFSCYYSFRVSALKLMSPLRVFLGYVSSLSSSINELLHISWTQLVWFYIFLSATILKMIKIKDPSFKHRTWYSNLMVGATTITVIIKTNKIIQHSLIKCPLLLSFYYICHDMSVFISINITINSGSNSSLVDQNGPLFLNLLNFFPNNWVPES